MGDTVKVSFEGKVTRVLPAFTNGDHAGVELRIEPEDGFAQYVTTDAANVELIPAG